MSEGQWKQSENPPNLEGTQVGDLLQHLIKLKEHFDGELSAELEKLSFLEKKREMLLIQKRKQKTHG